MIRAAHRIDRYLGSRHGARFTALRGASQRVSRVSLSTSSTTPLTLAQCCTRLALAGACASLFKLRYAARRETEGWATQRKKA